MHHNDSLHLTELLEVLDGTRTDHASNTSFDKHCLRQICRMNISCQIYPLLMRSLVHNPLMSYMKLACRLFILRPEIQQYQSTADYQDWTPLVFSWLTSSLSLDTQIPYLRRRPSTNTPSKRPTSAGVPRKHCNCKNSRCLKL